LYELHNKKINNYQEQFEKRPLQEENNRNCNVKYEKPKKMLTLFEHRIEHDDKP